MQKELIKVGKNIIAGVNGDFFSWLGVPTGLQICNGEIFKFVMVKYSPLHPQLRFY